MSALDELWQLLRRKTTQTEPGTQAPDIPAGSRQQAGDLNIAESPPEPGNKPQISATETRTQRNWRYRAGPWQMK
jgi:hypothetical protein